MENDRFGQRPVPPVTTSKAPKTKRKKGKTANGIKKLNKAFYEKELERLQRRAGQAAGVGTGQGTQGLRDLFEGRDAAGKGGAIKRIVERTNPRVVQGGGALAKPNERELTQWYFQRYVAHLPAAGEIVLFDRSWYNRAGVEHVMGFCTDEEYEDFLRSAPEFERMLIRSNTILDQVLVLGQRRGAGAPLPRSDRESGEALEAQSDGHGVAGKRWVEYSIAKDKHVRRHRHQGLALVGRRRR